VNLGWEFVTSEIPLARRNRSFKAAQLEFGLYFRAASRDAHPPGLIRQRDFGPRPNEQQKILFPEHSGGNIRRLPGFAG